jgi:37-kD nucleoid-associated bacterial protein
MTTVTAADITVTDAILHLLDPEDGGFKPSLRALPDIQGEVGDFLAGHIAHGLSDSQIKGARFTAFSDDTAPVIMQQLIIGSDFVADSQALAQSAYKIMEADKRIRPPGSLAVVRYLTAALPGVPHLAVLKLDKGGKFRWSQRTDAAGTAYWNLEETTNVAPSAEERLHKAAFVGPVQGTTGTLISAHPPGTADSHAHQFLVLDRQVKIGADWWLGKFLIAEQALTDDDRAERWLKGALVGKTKIQHRLTDYQRNGLDLAIQSAMAGALVNIPEWVKTIDAPEELKIELMDEIDTRLPDNEFATSDTFRKKYGKRKWIGDNGLRVTIDAAYADQVQQKQVSGGWEITIKTSRWDSVP